MTGGRTMDRRRRRPLARRPGLFVFVGWVLLAGVVAVGRFLDDDADDEQEEVAVSPATVVAEPEHAPVLVVAAPPASAAEPVTTPKKKRALPKPFETVREFASPLLTPRLHLSRALVPKLIGLRSLLARARPGEPVAVTLTAYCLQGRTRRGRPVRPGIIAADPRVFPLARHVELFAGGRFIGRFLVDDTGKRIRGTRIDIWTPDCDDARRFGSRSGVATLVAAD
ncbi:3D domain-containing protein [Gemmatirosa kalamazoonensis]|uniref:3D domain-containing protein n=2 Tax=Gemmatirosa kalamazoonensis TaxID=861299 RepID=W0RKV2_9BACT|nr:3D domain-containing protein [Gemmatirosa kalamazoonensis]